MSYSRREWRVLAPAHVQQGGNCLVFCHRINVLTSVLLTGKSELGGIGSLPSPAANAFDSISATGFIHSLFFGFFLI